MNEMLKAPKEYLDNGIIRVLCNPITNYSCVSFHDIEHGVYVNTGLGASSIRSVGSLLKIYESKNSLTPKKICEITKIPESAYDRIKNQSTDFDNYDKNQICILAICFKLTPTQIRRFLNAAHILLQPLSYSFDAAFDFYINNWHYTIDNKENINNFLKCCKYSEEYLEKCLGFH